MGLYKRSAGILAGLGACILIADAADTHRFVVREYTVRTAKVREALTFVFVSDLHEKEYGRDNRKLVAAIRARHPDAVLVGGDLIVANRALKDPAGSWMRTPLALLRALAREYPVFLVNGNHEDRLIAGDNWERAQGFWPSGTGPAMYQEYMAAVRDLGVRCLHNARAQFGDVVLWGLELDHSSYNKLIPWDLKETEVEDTIGGRPDPARFNLLLAHNPKYFDRYIQWGADLVLSGHIHGGAVRIGRQGLVSPEIRFFPKYSGGAYQEGRPAGRNLATDRAPAMIVSCGLGTHTLPVRICNPGDLDVIRILPGTGG